VIAPGAELSPDVVPRLQAFGARGVVAFDQQPLSHVYTYVVEQARIGRLALEHLASRGHRRVLALMPDDADVRRLVDQRMSGATAAAREHGVSLRSVTVPVRRESIKRALATELDRSKRATGIYAFNDEQAIVALEVLRDRGLALPEEMALIGCDDSPAAEQMRPRLTTVRFDDHGRWREIARHLHAMTSGDGEYPEMTTSEPVVIAGQTT
jgi:DNA-binding LacI/PurR family transcriptional regulator